VKSQAVPAAVPEPMHETAMPRKLVSSPGPVLWWITGYLTAGIALFFCYLHISYTQPVSSDGASNALQAWDMLHGNVLLRGWTVSDVSFYTTELPEYALVEVFRGLGPADVHVSAAVSYTLLVLLAGLLAKGRATGRATLLRVVIASGIMVAPQIGSGTYILLLSPDHTGTGVPLLAIWLLVEYAPRRRYTPVLVGLALTWATIGDRLVALMAALPMVVMCSIRVRRSAGQHALAPECRHDTALAIAAGASVPAAILAVSAIPAIGGYAVLPLRLGIMSPGSWWLNLRVTAEGILGLYGADFTGHSLGLYVLVAAIHFIGLGLAAWGLLRGIRRIRTAEDMIVGALSIAVVINLLIFMCSDLPHTQWDAREIAVTLPYGAVLAGRQFPGTLLKRALARRVLLASAACYLFALCYALSYPASPANDQDLANWLSRHHLTCGLGSYADGNVTTLDSSGRIQLRAPAWTSGGVYPGGYESKNAWFSPATCDATFVVSTAHNGESFYVPPALAIKAFGKPRATYRYATYTIMIWPGNLFDRLRRPSSPAITHRWTVGD
jgi:hypothetical protein